MVQIKALTTFLVATTLILPSLAVPLNAQESTDLFARDYEDGLVERDFDVDLEARDPDPKFNFGRFLKSIFLRELEEAEDLQARDPDPKFNFGRFLKSIFLRELDEADDLLARDNTFEADLD